MIALDASACRAAGRSRSANLVDLIDIINSELTKNDRKKLITLCTIDVHARDVVQRLMDERVENVSCFQWQSQLRYYQNEKTKEAQVSNNPSLVPTCRGPASSATQAMYCAGPPVLCKTKDCSESMICSVLQPWDDCMGSLLAGRSEASRCCWMAAERLVQSSCRHRSNRMQLACHH